jgi:hypothetical protein
MVPAPRRPAKDGCTAEAILIEKSQVSRNFDLFLTSLRIHAIRTSKNMIWSPEMWPDPKGYQSWIMLQS